MSRLHPAKMITGLLHGLAAAGENLSGRTDSTAKNPMSDITDRDPLFGRPVDLRGVKRRIQPSASEGLLDVTVDVPLVTLETSHAASIHASIGPF